MIERYGDSQKGTVFVNLKGFAAKQKSGWRYSMPRHPCTRCATCEATVWKPSMGIAPDNTYSIRINRQWRICFEWPAGEDGPLNVEITDYHMSEDK